MEFIPLDMPLLAADLRRIETPVQHGFRGKIDSAGLPGKPFFVNALGPLPRQAECAGCHRRA